MTYLFISGGIMMCSVVVALFFLRFWRQTKDRFFGIFGLAFLIMAFERLVLAIVVEREASPAVYLMRFLAFCAIIAAVVDKNLRAER